MLTPIKQKPDISFTDFKKFDIRVGTVISVTPFPKAKKPAYQLQIDLGALGIKNSSAQITDYYQADALLNKQVIVVVNLGKKQIGHFFSECLVLGIYDDLGKVILLQPERPVHNGASIG